MRRRHKLSKRKSRKLFRSTAGVRKSLNRRKTNVIKRGGIRL